MDGCFLGAQLAHATRYREIFVEDNVEERRDGIAQASEVKKKKKVTITRGKIKARPTLCGSFSGRCFSHKDSNVPVSAGFHRSLTSKTAKTDTYDMMEIRGSRCFDRRSSTDNLYST